MAVLSFRNGLDFSVGFEWIHFNLVQCVENYSSNLQHFFDISRTNACSVNAHICAIWWKYQVGSLDVDEWVVTYEAARRCLSGMLTCPGLSNNNNNNNNHFISIAVNPLRRTAGTHHIYRTSVGTQARTTSHKQQGLARAEAANTNGAKQSHQLHPLP